MFKPCCLINPEGVNFLLAMPLALVLAIPAWPQTSGSQLPRFEDYPVGEIFTGTLADPKLTTPLERMYRTVIRQGVAKGWGVRRDGKETNVPGPNFAGNMIVVHWGCGVPCLSMALVHAKTGTIYYPPISSVGVGVRDFALPLLTPPQAVSRQPDVDFRLDSKLMIVKATPKQTWEHPSFTYYFLWQGDRWSLLRKVPLVEE